MKRSFLVLATVLAVAVAGCGSDSDSSTSSTTTAAPAATSATTGAAAGGTVTVEMKNIQFVPKDVTVDVGQTIKWVNLDNVDHDADATKGADFESDLFGQGGTFEWTAEKPGKVEYVCSVHPGMTGTITVR